MNKKEAKLARYQNIFSEIEGDKCFVAGRQRGKTTALAIDFDRNLDEDETSLILCNRHSMGINTRDYISKYIGHEIDTHVLSITASESVFRGRKPDRVYIDNIDYIDNPELQEFLKVIHNDSTVISTSTTHCSNIDKLSSKNHTILNTRDII